jgi:cytochrome c peroxidase
MYVRVAACAACVAALTVALAAQGHAGKDIRPLDAQLTERLRDAGFTGRAGSTLTLRLGRPIDKQLADLGRLLWFDTITGLNGDNSCAGCHSPTNGFGDTQPIAIGIGNNGVVGPDRTGPRNERRAPMIINSAFFPRLMWNSRFSSLSGDPFDNSGGFLFPAPEGTTLSHEPQLLVAQAFIPPTERTEVAGFDFPGDNDAIRAEVVRRLDAIPAYRELFARSFPAVTRGDPITYEMLASAIAEFEFSLIFADAPVDRYGAFTTRTCRSSATPRSIRPSPRHSSTRRTPTGNRSSQRWSTSCSMGPGKTPGTPIRRRSSDSSSTSRLLGTATASIPSGRSTSGSGSPTPPACSSPGTHGSTAERAAGAGRFSTPPRPMRSSSTITQTSQRSRLPSRARRRCALPRRHVDDQGRRAR